eukprot:gnl/MRDRNA2_/MRDRNA2_243290_c0_seq1.p1 gnl/MRDRNA2_/MRDRNA2_243290_c0~~gnl/MRDRNA2_/MRDRNA2_243290_c0_seq1.p1  ORF type:complete len:179 (+),score=26.94 gnl/MRDRNA2_/MRDRNA2_243290_c0_seq1:43-537(+)
MAAYSTAELLGSQSTGALVDRFGPDFQATLSHVGIVVAFALWGAARTSAGMALTLLPLTLSFGRGAVLQSKAIVRATELGLGRGEASSAIGCLGSCGKMLAPRLFVALYGATGGKAPMFFVAALGVLFEVLHRLAVRARHARWEILWRESISTSEKCDSGRPPS